MDKENSKTQNQILLQPGTLWHCIQERTEHALKCGALLSIPTEFEFVEQDGVRFLVRIMSNLVRKDKAKQQQEKQKASTGKEFNPFLPYEADLFVADISPTHVCLLNKYNVVDYHLLIITREFEQQESPLTWADFQAMGACLAEFDGLVFYNSGKVAGASQRHKHLQMVPLPLSPDGTHIPIAPLLKNAQFKGSIGTIPQLPFLHAFTSFNPDCAAAGLESYYQLLTAVGLPGNNQTISGAYNLLATREWMLIVPRSQESFQSIPVNSLGFAGAMLVRNSQQMQVLKDIGPMGILSQVGSIQ
ncbi:MAG: phosphorylase [Calothrix sp. MO_167.B12]|nr:phosphorylase [Calothrix sp. MO_167.B12]